MESKMEYISKIEDEYKEFDDEILKTIEDANKQVKNFTNDSGYLRSTPISDNEVIDAIFETDNHKFTNVYHLDYIYTIPYEDNIRKFRSRIGALAYSNQFPAKFKCNIETQSPENYADRIIDISNLKQFQKMLISLLNSRHFMGLLFRAKRENEPKKETQKDLH
jgi:hypothetical protein